MMVFAMEASTRRVVNARDKRILQSRIINGDALNMQSTHPANTAGGHLGG